MLAVLVPGRFSCGRFAGRELKDVWQAESAVYGGTSRASSVVVRLFGSPRVSVSVVEENEELPGLAYMYWSVFEQKR